MHIETAPWPAMVRFVRASTPDELRAACAASIAARRAEFEAERKALIAQAAQGACEAADMDVIAPLIHRSLMIGLLLDSDEIETDITEDYRILYGTQVFPEPL